MTDVSLQLASRFANPLEGNALRRIVMWHDAEGAFEDAFDRLSRAGIESARTVRCVKADEEGAFALKRQIYRLHAEDDFLIYSRGQKDLSPKGLEGNWLADIEFLAEHFQADFDSLVLDELGAADAAREGVRCFGRFFKAADRRARFKRLVPAARNVGDVASGVIGGVLAASDLSAESLVRTFLCQLETGKGPVEALAKYDADEAFASLLRKRAGYSGDLANLDDLAAHLLLTAASVQLPEEALRGLEAHVSASHGQFCLNAVHAWMEDEDNADLLFNLCRRVESRFNLDQRFGHMACDQLLEVDVFPCVNECILGELLISMGQGADRTDEADRALRRRRNLRWFSRVEAYYAALEAAVDTRRFYSTHAEGFHLAVPADVWKAYTDDWFHMDTAYRGFCKAYDRCEQTTADLPAELGEGLEALAAWMENLYVNWFLSESNACWVRASQEAWERDGYVQDVPRQRSFFEEHVLAGASGAKKTMVIVSDALRYEVAVELCDRLRRDTDGSVEVGSMQGVFPSTTEFGMAALLPHASMQYSWEDGGVFLNYESLPTVSTDDRQRVLRVRKPNGRCLQSKELMRVGRTERKSLVEGAEVVYVYHNKIDAFGEAYSTERMVFEACDTAIDDLVVLVRSAKNDMGFSRVLITADHGFLYTRDALREHDRVSSKEASANIMKSGRRYAIGKEAPDDSLFIEMNVSDVCGGEYVGLAARECVRIKKPGDGENYVHGGVSLQECCVPIVQFRSMRARAKGYEKRVPAELKLLRMQRRVTSMMFEVDLFQKSPVGGKVLPVEYELAAVDADGDAVSDACRACADSASPDEHARVSRVRFALKAGREYGPSQAYYLTCRNKATRELLWKEEFRIDIPFAPLDDFSF